MEPILPKTMADMVYFDETHTVLDKIIELENSKENISSGKGLSTNDFTDAYRDKLDSMAETRSHQGIIADVEDYKYVEVSEIIDYAKSKNEEPFIVVLDEIEDPHNFGAIIRSAECVGAHGVIIKNRNQAMVTATVVSSSAGATEFMRIARVTNISKTIEELKDQGMWFACADMDGTEMQKTNLKGSIGLVVGSEGKGVSRLVKEKCDFVVKIPMKGHIDSLNVSVATGVLLYEINRQRNV